MESVMAIDMESGRWIIENKLLKCMILHGNEITLKQELGIAASWSTGQGFAIIKGVLTWMVMRALSVERLPWATDYVYSIKESGIRNQIIQTIEYLYNNKDIVDGACNELKEIYSHTQNFYRKKEIESIQLDRSYKNFKSKHESGYGDLDGNYASYLLVLAEHAKSKGETKLKIPHDVITSWGSKSYTGCSVSATRTFDISEILFSSETLSPIENGRTNLSIEPGEYLIINRDLKGLLELPVDKIKEINGYVVTMNEQDKIDIINHGYASYNIGVNFLINNYNIKSKLKRSLKYKLQEVWDILRE